MTDAEDMKAIEPRATKQRIKNLVILDFAASSVTVQQTTESWGPS